MKIISVLFVCFIISAISGQNTDFEKIKNKITKPECIYIEFVQNAKIGGNKAGSSFKAKLFFKKENMYKVEFKKNIIVCNGKTLWNYNKDFNRVVINSPDDENTIFNVQKLFEELNTYKITENSEKKMIILEAKNLNTSFKKVKIFYDKDFSIEKLELFDLTDNITEVEIKKIKYNENYSDGFFEFTAPKGSQVIDLR